MEKTKIALINSLIIDKSDSAYSQIDVVYEFVKHLSYEYPNFEDWFYNKVIKGLDKRERMILTCTKNDIIAGVAILKNTSNEKKICTIRVHPKFRRQGIGKTLIEKSFELLETEKPIITVSSARIEQFETLLRHFDFKLEMKAEGFYAPDITEYVFNGELMSVLTGLDRSKFCRAFKAQTNMFKEYLGIAPGKYQRLREGIK